MDAALMPDLIPWPHCAFSSRWRTVAGYATRSGHRQRPCGKRLGADPRADVSRAGPWRQRMTGDVGDYPHLANDRSVCNRAWP